MVKAEFFYDDDGMVESTDLGCFQLAFNILTGKSYRVGLQMNVQKTVWMVCRPFRMAGVQSGEAYTRRITGEGGVFKERQRERVICP